jgi:hypothetical protein
MFFITRTGVRVLGLALRAPDRPGPNWWEHNSACAWTAAWLTVRERRFLGEPEISQSGEWSERLNWYDRSGHKKSGHRPDLIAWPPGATKPYAIEVELAQKSRTRLSAILGVHDDWILHNKIEALLYIVGDQEGARRIRRAADRKLFLRKGYVRIELLDTIKQQTIEAFDQRRGRQPAPAIGGT